MSTTAADQASTGRIRLVMLSPRVAPGLLSHAGWAALTETDRVFAADADPRWLQAVDDARSACRVNAQVEDLGEATTAARAGTLVEAAASGEDVAWLGSPDGDPGLTDLVAEHLSRLAITGMPPEIEVVSGSWDVPGARVLDLVAVMDTLRSPGGCPWDAEQTHSSLLRYLLEETHEVIEAVEAGDRAHLQEELGDLLLQVVFHARIAGEDDLAPFGIDEVAAGIVEKMVRRHPHVFGDGEAHDADAPAVTASDVRDTWEQRKAVEKRRESPFEGIPAGLPALARAQKMVHRLRSLRPDVDLADLIADVAGDDAVVAALMSAVADADVAGADVEGVLRQALRRLLEREG